MLVADCVVTPDRVHAPAGSQRCGTPCSSPVCLVDADAAGLVVLDDQLQVRGVMHRGRWVVEP